MVVANGHADRISSNKIFNVHMHALSRIAAISKIILLFRIKQLWYLLWATASNFLLYSLIGCHQHGETCKAAAQPNFPPVSVALYFRSTPHSYSKRCSVNGLYPHLLPLELLLVLDTRNSTDGNKFVIFSGIALWYNEVGTWLNRKICH